MSPLKEISSSLPGFCVTGRSLHSLECCLGWVNAGSKFQSRNKGKIKLFFQIDCEEFGGEKSKEIKKDR